MKKEKLSPIIVALDLADSKKALRVVDQLSDSVDIFKVGLQLFAKEGPAVIDQIIRGGKKVFVDLKLHDIPNTVAGTLENLVRPGVEFVTLHGLGGHEMLLTASKTVDRIRKQNSRARSRLLCVTVLTSLDGEDLNEIGIDHSAAGQVLNLARLAVECGLSGVVASPEEVAILRQEIGDGLTIVTPGVRLAEDKAGDQKRVATPQRAIRDGANFVVMGRSLLTKPKPAEVVKKILESLE